MGDDIGKATKGGWGNVVGVNKESHITITNEKADTGKGVPNVREFFDNDGNYLGSEQQ